MQKIKNSQKGFTLIELLVVVAIIAALTSITLGYLSSSRKKGADTGVKSNLATVHAVSEIFYLDNFNSYLPSGGSTFNIATCPLYNASGTNMLSKSKSVADAIAEATRRGIGNSCYNSNEVWSVAVGLNVVPNTSWCVDNSGAARVVSSVVSSAINGSTGLCN